MQCCDRHEVLLTLILGGVVQLLGNSSSGTDWEFAKRLLEVANMSDEEITQTYMAKHLQGGESQVWQLIGKTIHGEG